jgi:hypothetical protein
MSNSFTTPPQLADETTVVAGLPIAKGAVTLMSETMNYLWHYGSTTNVLSQAWADGQFVQRGTSLVEMAEWMIPVISNDHHELEVIVIAKGSGTIRLELEGATTAQVTDEVSSIGAGPHLVRLSLILGTPTDEHLTLSMLVAHISGDSARHEIQSIMARWVPLASPVTAGARYRLNDKFVPFGIDRVGNDYPLSSRWGVNALNNVELLRKRPVVYLTWSGIQNLDSAPTREDDPAPPKYLGIGDIDVLAAPVHIPTEAVLGDSYEIKVALLIGNLQAGGTFSYSVLGTEIEVSANGWHIETVRVLIDRDETMSRALNLNIYRVGPDNDPINLSNLASLDTYGISNLPQVQAICVWGV